MRTGYRRKNGRLEYRFVYKNRRCSVYGSTYEECEQRADEKKSIIDAGHIQRPHSDITLSDFYKVWQTGREVEIAPSTRYTNDTRFGYIKDMIGHLQVAEITPTDIKSVRAALRKRLSVTTVNDVTTMLKSLFNSAIDDDIITTNPCRGLKGLRDEDSVPATETYHRALTEEEQKLFFQYAKNSWYYEVYAFMILTGCRIGEVGALTWGDVDYKQGLISINKTVTRISNTEWGIGKPKTKSSKRKIPLSNAVKEVLTSQRRKTNTINSADRIFQTKSGLLLQRNLVNQDIRAVLKRIEEQTLMLAIAHDDVRLVKRIEHFTSHAFRDTFATRAIEQGMKPNTLKKILGHSSIRITMDIYAHVLPNIQMEEIEALSIVV